MEYSFKNSKHNDQKRSNKNNRLSDSIVAYEDVALEYFKDLDGNVRCALSGEILQEDNLSKEHIIALAIGGHDIAANIVPSAMGYNLIKSDIYLLKYLELQENQEGKKIYSSYRLLKILNYMLKSINARESEIKEYREAILIPNGIDEYLRNIEINDKQAIYPEKKAPKKGEASTIERNNQEIEYEGEGITISTFICDAINKLRDEGMIPEEYINQLENIFENTRENEVFKKLDTELEMRQEIIRVLRDRNIGNEYDIAYIMQQSVDSKEEIIQKIDMTLKNISELLKQKGIDEEWASIVLENRPELLINIDEISRINKTIEFYANQSELDLEFFNECFSYNKVARKYIEIFNKLKEKGLDLTKVMQKDTLGIFLEREGYDIKNIEIEDFNIGRIIHDLSGGHIQTTEEERAILLELGILEEEHIKKLSGEVERMKYKSAIEYIEIFQKLADMELKLSGDAILYRDTLESFLERNNNAIEETGIEDFNIGKVRDKIRLGRIRTNPNERKILLNLGILEEEHVKKLGGEVERIKQKSAIEYIEIFQKLVDMEVELSEIDIERNETLAEFLRRNGKSIIGLEEFADIKLFTVRDSLRNGKIRTNAQERKILIDMGILEEIHIKKLEGNVERTKKISTQKWVDMFVQLGNMGLELNTIQRGDTVEKFLNRNGKTIEGFEDIASIDIYMGRDSIRCGRLNTTDEERKILLKLEILEEKHIKKLEGKTEKVKFYPVQFYIEIFQKLADMSLDLVGGAIKRNETLAEFLARNDKEIAGFEEAADIKLFGVRDKLRSGDKETTEGERAILLELGILEEKHIKSLKQKDEEKALKVMKKSVAQNVKDNEKTRREIQEQVMSMQMSNSNQHSQYQSIGR